MLGQTPPSGHGGKNDEAVKKKGKQIFVPKIGLKGIYKNECPISHYCFNIFNLIFPLLVCRLNRSIFLILWGAFFQNRHNQNVKPVQSSYPS
jgi:hypothetical protein